MGLSAVIAVPANATRCGVMAAWAALASNVIFTVVRPRRRITARSSNHALNSGPAPTYRTVGDDCPRFSTKAKGICGDPAPVAALAIPTEKTQEAITAAVRTDIVSFLIMLIGNPG